MAVLEDIQILLGRKKINQPVNRPPKKLLIVEDEPILREMYQDKFKLEGFAVITAENGHVGLEKAIEYKPDVILLDLMMPVMDGKTMLRKLRALPQYKKTPVFVLTNAGEAENIREAHLYYDAIEFLIKSNISLEEIVLKVKRQV
jgi:DNA-binding response OmpR family regulator